MLNEAVVTAISDPLDSVAEAWDAAVQGAKEEMEDERATASGTLPAPGGPPLSPDHLALVREASKSCQYQ
jgi:hypothetical protein